MVARKIGYHEEDDMFVYDILVEGHRVGQLGMGEETYRFKSPDTSLKDAVHVRCTGDMSFSCILSEIRTIIEERA